MGGLPKSLPTHLIDCLSDKTSLQDPCSELMWAHHHGNAKYSFVINTSPIFDISTASMPKVAFVPKLIFYLAIGRNIALPSACLIGRISIPLAATAATTAYKSSGVQP